MAITKVIHPMPAPQPGSTRVRRSVLNDVSKNGTTSDIYTLQSGSVLTLQWFGCGCECSTSGGRVELIYRTSGSADDVLAVGYVNGSSFSVDMDETFVGDGSNVIVMRRTNHGGGSLHMFGRWTGYTG